MLGLLVEREPRTSAGVMGGARTGAGVVGGVRIGASGIGAGVVGVGAEVVDGAGVLLVLESKR